MISIEQSVKVNIPVRNAYRHLADFESYPRFMENVRDVRRIGDMRLQWRIATEQGEREWEMEITELSPEKCIAWRNLSGPVGVGSLVLDPVTPDQTMVTAILTCHPSEDEAQSENIRRFLSRQMQRNIARFKKFAESSEKREAQSSAEEKAFGSRASAQDEISDPAAAPRAGEPASAEGKRRTSRARASRTRNARTENAAAEPAAAKAKPQSVPGDGGNWAPPVEIAHGETEVIVCAELPGVKREDIRIEIRGERLTIEGERSLLRSLSEMEYRRSERPYGHFSRLIVLPDGIDARAAAASLQDGVLEIRVPMASRARPDAHALPAVPL